MDFRGISPMIFEGNVAEHWKFWCQKFQMYLAASELTKKSEATQCAQLLHLIGDEGIRIYNTFTFEDGEKDKIKALIDKFQAHFSPKRNLTFERHKFLSSKQVEGQTLEQYITELKNKALSCELGNLRDSLTKDVLICGIRDHRLREKLLEKDDISLDECIQLGKNMETSKARSRQMRGQQGDNIYSSHQIDYVNRYPLKKTVGKAAPGILTQYRSKEINVSENVCRKCGFGHSNKSKCPAEGKVCQACGKLNHFKNMCFSKKSKYRKDKKFVKNKISEIVEQCESDSDDDNNFAFIGSVEAEGSGNRENKEPPKHVIVDSNVDNSKGNGLGESWVVNLNIRNEIVQFKVDTGACANILPVSVLNKINFNLENLKKTKSKLVSYTKNQLPVIGECSLSCKFRNKTYLILFQVVNMESFPILGLKSCLELNILKRIDNVSTSQAKSTPDSNVENILGTYKDVFVGIGHLKDKYHIDLKDNVKPVIHQARKVPFTVKEKLKETLDKLEKQKIIVKADNESPDWVNAVVLVRKPDGSIRICLDPKDLNEAIKRQYFQIPTLEELTSDLSNCKYFSTLDMTQGFLQIPLDTESSKLCTFATCFGRYRYLRLPYGINSAPEIYQQRMSKIFSKVKNCNIYIDDVIISGKTKREHDETLKEVLEIARQNNIKFNRKKCKFQVREVKYMGHVISEAGISPDDNKIQAIKNMQTPANIKDVQRLLGMVTYVAKFIPNLAEITSPLRKLLHKEVEFSWNVEQEKCFNEIKQILSSEPCLKFYDINKPTVISVDSSQAGMGAALLQENAPCAYASRAFNETQLRYAQIEKELLAICFGVQKFYQYVFGKRFTVETDHKPLLQVLKKPIYACPARLQKMLVQLRKFDFDLIYKPGKDLIIADTLSRAFEKEFFDENIDIELKAQVCLITNNLNITPGKYDELKRLVKKDTELKLLRHATRKGWPKNIKDVPTGIKFFYRFRHEITVADDGLVYKGQKLIIPTSLRREILDKLHLGHQGITKTINKANLSFYWPGLNKHIEDMITKCHICQQYQKSKQPEPMIPHEITKIPWYKVACDLMHFDNNVFLIATDYYSKFFEIANLNRDLTSENVIVNLKSIFSRQGIPNILMSDNGPEFSSLNFRKFAKEWDFTHIKASPRYPQSNGAVERTVQTIKNMLRKCKLDNKDPYLGLLSLRNTPIDSTNSPANILYNRNLRELLPQNNDYFLPKNVNVNFNDNLDKRQSKQKFYYDRKAKSLPKIKDRSTVRVQVKPKSQWYKGQILEQVGIRAYKVRLDDGSELIRNRRFINVTTDSDLESEPDQSTSNTLETYQNNEDTLEELITNPNVELEYESCNETLSNTSQPSDSSPENVAGSSFLFSPQRGDRSMNSSSSQEHSDASSSDEEQLKTIVTARGRVIKKPNKLNL